MQDGQIIKKTELDSGIRVLSEHMPGVRSASLGIWIESGSRDEEKGEEGICHFLEHMVFKGTNSFTAREIAEEFDSMGADINGATGKESTVFFARVPDENIPRALQILMDMAKEPKLDPKDIEAERQVILEEINMYMDSPDAVVQDLIIENLWDGHPAGHNILGEAEVIRNMDKKMFEEFHSNNYVGSRIIVVGAGALNHDQLVELVSNLSEGIEVGSKPSRSAPASDPKPKTTIMNKETEQAHIALGAKGLPRGDPARFALALMDNVLGGSMSSRLFQKVREEMGLVYSIYSFTALLIGMGMVGIYCGTHPSQAHLVVEILEEELARVGAEGFTEKELKRAKQHVNGAFLIGLEDSYTRMRRIAKAELGGEEHLSPEELIERINKTTLEDVENVFKKTWMGNGLSLAVVGPLKEGEVELGTKKARKD
ncbi:MAG: pitrilysin family protein [Actinomycetota bacterium]|nr:pitrilysin family protein [Actinomycetota bacterium]